MPNFPQTIIDRYDTAAGIMLVGSRVNPQVELPDDWDFLVISARRDMFRCLAEDAQASHVSDDSIRFTLEGRHVGLAPLTPQTFRQRIDNTLAGQINMTYKPWAIGAVVPEGFLADVAAAKITRDRQDNLLNRYQQKLNPYPKPLREMVKRQCIEEIHDRLQQQEKALKRNDTISMLCLKAHIVFCILRLLTALEGRYFSGTKHTELSNFVTHQDQIRILHQLVEKAVDQDWLLQTKALLTSLN